MVSKTSRVRRVLYLKVQALREQEEMQTRLEKLRCEAKESEKAAFQEALARKSRIAEIQREIADLQEEFARKGRKAEIKREIAEAPISQRTNFRSIPSERLGWMVKSETVKNGTKSNMAVSVHSTPENAVKLVHEGKFSAPRRASKPPQEADERAIWKHRTNYENRSCRQGAISQREVEVGNKGTSKLHTAQCIQNWSETVVVEKCRKDIRSETPLVDTTQILKREIHLAMNEHSIVQTEVNLNYTMTVMMQEYRSSAFATSKQNSEELSVQMNCCKRVQKFPLYYSTYNTRNYSK